MEFMIYKDFLKIAKKIGDGGKCEVSIDGKKTKNAMLSRKDSEYGLFKNEWFILQNIVNWINAKDKKGYKYPYIILDNTTSDRIDYIRPLAKKAPQNKTTKSEKKDWILIKDFSPQNLCTKKECDDTIRKNLNMNLYALRISEKYKVVRTNDFTLEEVK